MHLVRFVHTIDPAAGGPIAGVRAVSPLLAEAGHVTDVVTFDPPPSEPVAIPGVRAVHHFGAAAGAPQGAAAPAVGQWIAAHGEDYDAAIAHGLWQPQTRAVGRHFRRRPYFVFPHGMLDPWFRRAYPLKHLKKQLYWLLVERHTLRRAAAVLYTCEEERRLARRTFWPYACTERVVCYGSATPPAAGPAQAAAFSARVPDLADRPYWLFLGRIHEKKGVDLLLDAYAALARSPSPDTPGLPDLVIAGPCHEPAYLARLRTLAAGVPAPGRIHWAGMLEGDAKWGALAGAEAFVLPSHQENFGIAVVEALACGTPVLISAQINIWREIVGDGAGLVAPDTVAGTLQLLQRWLAVPATARTTMRRQATRSFAARYAMPAVASSLIETLVACGVRRDRARAPAR